MIGMKQGKLALSKKGKPMVRQRNDLFQVLREVGVRVKAEDDVDAALIKAAKQWMRQVVRGDTSISLGGDVGRLHNRGVMLVYSKDGDFAPLLEQARTRGFITV